MEDHRFEMLQADTNIDLDLDLDLDLRESNSHQAGSQEFMDDFSEADYLVQSPMPTINNVEKAVADLSHFLSTLEFHPPHSADESASKQTMFSEFTGSFQHQHHGNDYPNPFHMAMQLHDQIRQYEDTHIGLDVILLEEIMADHRNLDEKLEERRERIATLASLLETDRSAVGMMDSFAAAMSVDDAELLVQDSEKILMDTAALLKSKQANFKGSVEGLLKGAQQMYDNMLELKSRIKAAHLQMQGDRESRLATEVVSEAKQHARTSQDSLQYRKLRKEIVLKELKEKWSRLEQEGESKIHELEILDKKLEFLQDVVSARAEIINNETVELWFNFERPLRDPKFGFDHLKVTLHFRYEDDKSIVLRDLQMDKFVPGSEELIEKVKEDGDLPVFVRKMVLLWNGHIPLLSEVALLRSKHAIDWMDEERTLRVMLPGQGNVVATLSVPPMYPHRGEAKLIKLSDSSDTQDLPLVCDLSPQGPAKKTLSEWVLYLEKMFGQTT